MNNHTADYLIVGAGAMGMAFADTLASETDATIAIVDRYHQPGGHWNTAYPFVRLHQPSASYGVNSKPLGSSRIDQVGWNAGLFELASVGEVCAYFDQVMHQQLLPSGRVKYFPMTEHLGGGKCRSLVSGEEFTIDAKRHVDATYMRVTVPSMRPPPFEVEAGVQCVAPNELPRLAARHGKFVVIGGGKTGMDACLWLLRNGASPAAIRWIVPRDSWLLDRALSQPGPDFAPKIHAAFEAQGRAIMEATSVPDLFQRLLACGRVLRLTDDVTPTMYRCATVSQAELAQLRRIEDIVRKGRVEALFRDRIVLQGGSVPAQADTLYVDCSADGLERRPAVPVFAGRQITLQSVRTCQQVFSAAFIAHVEATLQDDAQKNDLTAPVPHPDADLDWLRTAIANMRNQIRWNENPEILAWLRSARLDWNGKLAPPLPDEPAALAEAIRTRNAGMRAMSEKLQALLDAAAA